MTLEEYQSLVEKNIKSNGLAKYTFYFKNCGKNHQILTPIEHAKAAKKGEWVFAIRHVGLKIEINNDISAFALFSKSPAPITYDKEIGPFKGVNRVIFINNKDFSQYYEADYRFSNFPNYCKNWSLKEEYEQSGKEWNVKIDREELCKSAINLFKYSFNQCEFNEKNPGDFHEWEKMLFAVKSNFSIHYVDFDYHNTMLCSNLGILAPNLSKLFLHQFNKNTLIKDMELAKKIKPNTIFEKSNVNLENNVQIIDEKQVITDLKKFQDKILKNDQDGSWAQEIANSIIW